MAIGCKLFLIAHQHLNSLHCTIRWSLWATVRTTNNKNARFRETLVEEVYNKLHVSHILLQSLRCCLCIYSIDTKLKYNKIIRTNKSKFLQHLFWKFCQWCSRRATHTEVVNNNSFASLLWCTEENSVRTIHLNSCMRSNTIHLYSLYSWRRIDALCTCFTTINLKGYVCTSLWTKIKPCACPFFSATVVMRQWKRSIRHSSLSIHCIITLRNTCLINIIACWLLNHMFGKSREFIIHCMLVLVKIITSIYPTYAITTILLLKVFT